MITVLFACVHNAGRSQIAAVWFNDLADPARARAICAHTTATRISALAAAMLTMLLSATGFA